MIFTAARSYRLEHGMPTNAVINPKDLIACFPNGRLPRCPLGTNDYKPFVYMEDPKCPNAPDSHKLPPPTDEDLKRM